jgi:predicted nuclease of predicted toxin-antitoxin system
VKFLVDNQLPAALSRYLQNRGIDSQHVNEVNLGSASEIEICRYAEAQDRIVISKDEDFLYLANSSKYSLRFVWVRTGIAEVLCCWEPSNEFGR